MRSLMGGVWVRFCKLRAGTALGMLRGIRCPTGFGMMWLLMAQGACSGLLN